MINDEDLKELFSRARTIAVIGAKDVTGQPVDTVGRYLMAAGYKVVPVHPKRRNVWGLTTYPSIGDVDLPVDIVDLFRAAVQCPEHARECTLLAPAPTLFWMQLGIRSPEAISILSPGPIRVVEDSCIMVEHRRLLG